MQITHVKMHSYSCLNFVYYSISFSIKQLNAYEGVENLAKYVIINEAYVFFLYDYCKPEFLYVVIVCFRRVHTINKPNLTKQILNINRYAYSVLFCYKLFHNYFYN